MVQILPYTVFYFDWFSIWVYISWSDLVSVVHYPYEETTSLEKLFVANFSRITRMSLLWDFLMDKYNSPWNNSWNKRNNSKFCQIFPINYYWKTQHKYTGLQINILEPINACSLVSSTRISWQNNSNKSTQRHQMSSVIETKAKIESQERQTGNWPLTSKTGFNHEYNERNTSILSHSKVLTYNSKNQPSFMLLVSLVSSSLLW